jgi:putative addiction module component (TIGR02574 family)
MTKAEKLVNEALMFPVEIRAKMVEELLKSINPVRKGIDAAWAKEAERRLKEFRSGKSNKSST